MAKQVQVRKAVPQAAKSNVAKAQGKGLKTVKKSVVWNFPLDKKNFYILAIGIGTIILGYILMATGITDAPAVTDGKWNNPLAVTIAPVILIIGYCVIIPYAILKFFNKKSQDNQ